MRRRLIVMAAALACLAASAAELQSGLQVGEKVLSYDPKHVAGPDRGKTTCPVC